MKARLLPEAEEEIRLAAQWYEDRETGLGGQFLEAVVDALVEIERHPRRFSKPPKLRSTREIHRLLLPRFPYSIIYEIRPKEVLVAAVAHASRRPNYWRSRLK